MFSGIIVGRCTGNHVEVIGLTRIEIRQNRFVESYRFSRICYGRTGKRCGRCAILDDTIHRDIACPPVNVSAVVCHLADGYAGDRYRCRCLRPRIPLAVIVVGCVILLDVVTDKVEVDIDSDELDKRVGEDNAAKLRSQACNGDCTSDAGRCRDGIHFGGIGGRCVVNGYDGAFVRIPADDGRRICNRCSCDVRKDGTIDIFRNFFGKA